EAKQGFDAFRKANPGHPRAAEASLALARLTALEAKSELAKAGRIDVPKVKDGDAASEAAAAPYKDKRKKAAAAPRSTFLAASAEFGQAAKQIQAQLDSPKLDAATRRALEREKFDAELARGINLYNLADTYYAPDSTERIQRSNYLGEAKKVF